MCLIVEMHARSCGAGVDSEVDIAVLPVLIAHETALELNRVLDLAEAEDYGTSLCESNSQSVEES